MLEKLIIWITHTDFDTEATQARWLAFDAQGNRIGFPQQGSLQEAGAVATHRRVVVMLPGERILSASARVPGNNSRRILQAAPYALEDRLAGDVDELHVALLEKHKDNECDFLVVEHDWLAEFLATLDAAGIRPHAVWPDYLGVPGDTESTNWLITEDNRLLSRDTWHGFAAPASDAVFLYSHRGDNEKPVQLAMVGDEPAPAALGERETSRFADSERAFTELAATIAALPGSGLLQGSFRRKREGAPDWKRWQWPAAAAIAWLVLALAAFGLETWQLQREHAMLEQATRELFQRALPGNRQIPGQERFMIEQALGSAGTERSRLLEYLGDVGGALQEVPGTRLNGFNYRSNYFELSVTLPDATRLERLRNTLAERAGQQVDVQSANSTRDGLEGRLLLSEGDQQ
ncbi:MAG: type II secretion system protein GspL [Proteobacteria bacterium]|nr:type II secretion system protein GspL [Pseudomonadota bacterium]